MARLRLFSGTPVGPMQRTLASRQVCRLRIRGRSGQQKGRHIRSLGRPPSAWPPGEAMSWLAAAAARPHRPFLKDWGQVRSFQGTGLLLIPSGQARKAWRWRESVHEGWPWGSWAALHLSVTNLRCSGRASQGTTTSGQSSSKSDEQKAVCRCVEHVVVHYGQPDSPACRRAGYGESRRRQSTPLKAEDVNSQGPVLLTLRTLEVASLQTSLAPASIDSHRAAMPMIRG